MNKWRLKTFGILLLTTFSQISYSMKKELETEIKFSGKFNLSMLPIELKILIIQQSIANYVNQNFDRNDIKNLEQNICNLVKGFPAYMADNLCWKGVNQEFNAIGCAQELDDYFKYFLTLKLSSIAQDDIKNLLATIKMDKKCSNMIIVLLIISMLYETLESLGRFKNVYNLMKKAINCRAIYFCRPVKKNESSFIGNFYTFKIMNFDLEKFEDSNLFLIFINNNQDFVYEIIFCLRTDLKQSLLNIAANQENFKTKYLNTALAEAIWSRNLIDVKKNISELTDIDDSCNALEQSSLILATIIEADEIIEYLLNNKADCYFISRFGKGALYYAASSKNPQLLKIFWENTNEGPYFFEAAILTENFELFEQVCKAVDMIEDKNEFNAYFGTQPILEGLMFAVEKNRISMFQRLLKEWDSCENFDHFLSIAIENNCSEMAKFLAINISTDWIYKTTLPFEIALEGDLPKMNLLIELGFNVELANDHLTLYTIVKQRGYEEIATLLKNWSRRKNISDKNFAKKKKESKRCILA